MSDFEDRLTNALRAAGDDAPEAAGLAPAARRRAGARRRRTALTSVVAVVAVAGVVGGAALLGSGDSDRASVADDPTPTSSTPAETRVETWRDVSVTVPSSWGHGSMSTWCLAGSDPETPVVERPGGVVADIACTPLTGYGVRFLADSPTIAAFGPGTVNPSVGDTYPAGSWQGWDTAGGTAVEVVAPTRSEAEQVLGSFSRLGGSAPDGNGCLIHPRTEPLSVPPGQVQLCRYGIDDWLEQSEVLTGQDAVDAVTALEGAPAKGDRMCTMALTGPRIQVTTEDAEGWVTLDSCQGFSWDGAEHDLTADVLYWMLSPGWSGGVEGDVPMPTELRQ